MGYCYCQQCRKAPFTYLSVSVLNGVGGLVGHQLTTLIGNFAVKNIVVIAINGFVVLIDATKVGHVEIPRLIIIVIAFSWISISTYLLSQIYPLFFLRIILIWIKPVTLQARSVKPFCQSVPHRDGRSRTAQAERTSSTCHRRYVECQDVPAVAGPACRGWQTSGRPRRE